MFSIIVAVLFAIRFYSNCVHSFFLILHYILMLLLQAYVGTVYGICFYGTVTRLLHTIADVA